MCFVSIDERIIEIKTTYEHFILFSVRNNFGHLRHFKPIIQFFFKFLNYYYYSLAETIPKQKMRQLLTSVFKMGVELANQRSERIKN